LTFCPDLPIWVAAGEIANGAGLGADVFPGVDCGFNSFSGDCDCAILSKRSLEPSTTKRQVGTACDNNSVPSTTAVQFSDLNGDGRAEYLYVSATGSVTAFLNLGGPASNPAEVSWLAQGVISPSNVPIPISRNQIIFADINGDGKSEFLFVHQNGSVEAWLNLGGPNDGPNAAQVAWDYQGFIATGIGEDGAGVRFADLSGDGRADYLWVDPNGAVTAFLNTGAANPAFPAQVTWLTQGVIATGVGSLRENIVFADINGDGRADYLSVSHVNGAVIEFENGGGPDNGPDADKINWISVGTIATGVGDSGATIQFADLTGDGRAEFIDVNAQTSAVNAWLNAC